MNKRGITITFNWILIIVVGAILFSFLVYFGFQQLFLGEKLLLNQVVKQIDHELDAFSISISSTKPIQLPKKALINIDCDKINYEDVEGKVDKIIFSRPNLKGNVNLWVDDWEFPFKIDSFYYLSNENDRFFIIGNEDFYFDLPKRFKKFNSLDLNNVKGGDTIIYFNNFDSNILNKNVKVIFVNGDEVTFYPENKKTKYYGEEMLYGTLFSKNFDEFICLKGKALTKLKVISGLYKQKALLLKFKLGCDFEYNEFINTLDKFEQDPLQFYSFLEQQNRKLASGECTYLY